MREWTIETTKTRYGMQNSNAKVYISVVCGNDKCPKFGDVFNRIIAHDPLTTDQVDLILDSWGQGSEDAEDYCRSCGELGIPLHRTGVD